MFEIFKGQDWKKNWGLFFRHSGIGLFWGWGPSPRAPRAPPWRLMGRRRKMALFRAFLAKKHLEMGKKNSGTKKFLWKHFCGENLRNFSGEGPWNVQKCNKQNLARVKYFPANYKYNSIKWIQVCKHLKIKTKTKVE